MKITIKHDIGFYLIRYSCSSSPLSSNIIVMLPTVKGIRFEISIAHDTLNWVYNRMNTAGVYYKP